MAIRTRNELPFELVHMIAQLVPQNVGIYFSAAGEMLMPGATPAMFADASWKAEVDSSTRFNGYSGAQLDAARSAYVALFIAFTTEVVS